MQTILKSYFEGSEGSPVLSGGWVARFWYVQLVWIQLLHSRLRSEGLRAAWFGD